ncbi:MOSC domain-containing protein [uncultured Cocleimonas sp.]|uniref:MOSC domain-containing protein n=1 Tax=uncultured Cocleimonas sp. TaxID=1051587 RepID=UPI0026233EE5|nr:MOSC N-terminal beta barrel domain-containing protein [uncultured Cocleimonas sp.]
MENEGMTSEVTVTSLIIYPVKSLAGIELQESEVDNMGLKYDRRWMLVSPEGKFLSQRTLPQMALIKTEIDDSEQNPRLTLSMDGKDSHIVAATDDSSEKMDVVIWGDELQVQKVGPESDAWLSDCLGLDCHLVYIADDVMRQCDLEFAEEGEQTGFADGFPMLFVSEESLNDLNQRLDKDVDMRRFRPNVVIAGCDAYAEDELKSFSIAGVSMKGVKPCSRCPMPMVDPDLGERVGQEPIATLSKYRKWNNKVFFGMNVIHQQQGVIRVGDSLVF